MMKRFFIITIFIIIGLSVGLVVYAKKNISKMEYEEFSTNCKYDLLINEQYNEMFNFENTFITKNIESPNELYELSDYVFIVEVEEKALVGKGIINKVKVKKVIKGNGVKNGEYIYIYDLVAFVWNDTISYLDGSTPLNVGGNYMVFVNRTKRANVNNSFIATSTKYSYISLDELPVLTEYEKYSKSLYDIANYQYIFLGSDIEEVSKYCDFISKIRIEYGDEIENYY